MQYKLLVLDLDGTLTNSKKEITPRTQASLIRLQQMGVKLVLASGRPTYGITPLAQALQMDRFGGYILAFNGGKILDASSLEVIYEQVLPCSIVPTLHEAATKANSVILTYLKGNILTECPTDKYVAYESGLTKMQAIRVDNFSQAIDFNPDKCLIVGEPEDLIPLCEQLNEQFPQQLAAYRSEPFFLEVVPKGVDKALSLERLLAHIGCSKEQMIAVGDGFNDLSMIQLAGLGVAMKNAQQEVKDAAQRVTLSNDQDGVAALVEELFF